MNDTERRGYEARRLADEPLLKEALERGEHDDIEEMLRLKGMNPEVQAIIDRINTRRGFVKHLEMTITLGKQEEHKRIGGLRVA
jgi:hypothetical protein